MILSIGTFTRVVAVLLGSANVYVVGLIDPVSVIHETLVALPALVLAAVVAGLSTTEVQTRT